MITFPGSKVNLGLRITEKLANGYHALESIFLPLKYSDILEIIPNRELSKSTFKVSGLHIDGDVTQNLVYKAWDLLNQKYDLPIIDVYLHKVVPMGAGIGGGSADASGMLKLINELNKLNIPKEKLLEYAQSLGADCPFFIDNKVAYVQGIGEKLSSIEVNLAAYHFILITPGIHINTREAFQHIQPKQPEISLPQIIAAKSISEWKNYIFNDFEAYAFKKHPSLKEIKDSLYNQGALFALMTGTGSSIYGIFDHKPRLKGNLADYPAYHEEF